MNKACHDRILSLLKQQAHRTALKELKVLLSQASPSDKAQVQRITAWVHLANADTEKAYELFWLQAESPGSRAGLLLLTLLAGQVQAAMRAWISLGVTNRSPLFDLPDACWHPFYATRAAIAQLQAYPFPQDSPYCHLAILYRAHLHRALGEQAAAFTLLSAIADKLPLAQWVRQHWLDQVACLPAPSPFPTRAQLVASNPTPGSSHGAQIALLKAEQLLLYPNTHVLQERWKRALTHENWDEALEMMRRALVLDPEHIPSREARWRLWHQLGQSDLALNELLALIEIYERSCQGAASQKAANQLAQLFPQSEQALLRVCMLQARLQQPLELAKWGYQLLRLCQERGDHDRFQHYQRWLLRQSLSLDDQINLRRFVL